MHLLLTFAVFALLTAAILLLRLRWTHLAFRARRLLVDCACAILALFALTWVTGWNLSSNRLNAALYWATLASYEFFILLFTRLRPRWLTLIIAIVLIVPILSASVFLPLTALFNTEPDTTVSIGDSFVSERIPWGTGPRATTGTDLSIYRQPPWMPFLRRRVQAARYFNGQCNASAAFATLQPDHKSVLMSCPAAPDQPPSAARSLVVKFY